MAKTKTKSSKKTRRKDAPASLASVLQNIAKHQESSTNNIDALISKASSELTEESDPQKALKTITSALSKNPTSLKALELAGEINIELEDGETAIRCFRTAAELDPEGEGSGAEKFLWLAQICLEGGEVAIGWYEKAVEYLRKVVAAAGNSQDGEEKEKLCSALCGMAEIYMTDLCMKPDAESRCETYITEALLVSPSSPEALSTLASIRISQSKPEDARAALSRSLEVWKGLELGDDRIPAYPFRLSFTRLLIECEMYEEAMDVLEGLQQEDDQMVDLWYIGGWCLFLIGSKLKDSQGKLQVANGEDVEDWRDTLAAAREWLWNCEKLYKAFEWEDEGIKDHASELLANIAKEIGDAKPEDREEEEGDDEEGDAEWEDDDEDEEMKDS
ncbi:hypothetical protein TWF679_001250 [Orbilia oligospora]|uniref:Assembly chaperone of rpl4 n=1 Tax=Orbilia oligospora TaxID=2813651 RepID=A0A8H8UVT1_ORBOL|nr:hypothetical protein TWF679_001250 [Orbilia oligospora]